MQYEPPKLSVFVTQFRGTIPPGTKDGITHFFTIWVLKGFPKQNDLKYQTHQFYYHLGFFRIYHNCPLQKTQPMVHCVVCDCPLPLDSCLLLYYVMVVAASSDSDMVLELDVDTTVPQDDYMLEVEVTKDGVEKEGVANREGKKLFA